MAHKSFFFSCYWAEEWFLSTEKLFQISFNENEIADQNGSLNNLTLVEKKTRNKIKKSKEEFCKMLSTKASENWLPCGWTNYATQTGIRKVASFKKITTMS